VVVIEIFCLAAAFIILIKESRLVLTIIGLYTREISEEQQ